MLELSPLVTATLLIFAGCCGSSYTLELITRTLNAGSSVTLAQFLGTAVITFIYNSTSIDGRASIYSPKVPLTEYLKLIGCHFTVSFLNNWVLDFQVSVPVHIILRSGVPVITMIMGWLAFSKRYTERQVAAVVVLSIGIVLSTLASRPAKKEDDEESNRALRSYIIGISLMTLATLISAFMSLYLERTFRSFKPSWKESLLYTHLLSLPFFLPLLPKIIPEFVVVMESAQVAIPGLYNIHVPIMVINYFGNIVTQFLCVAGVNMLASCTTGLTVTIMLNLRKFVSILFSFWYFQHHASLTFLFGAFLVFVGVMTYSIDPSQLMQKRPVESVIPDLREEEDRENAVPLLPMHTRNDKTDEKSELKG